MRPSRTSWAIVPSDRTEEGGEEVIGRDSRTCGAGGAHRGGSRTYVGSDAAFSAESGVRGEFYVESGVSGAFNVRSALNEAPAGDHGAHAPRCSRQRVAVRAAPGGAR